MPNADGAGYYRFALDAAGWRALEANFDRLNELEALAAADSLSAAYQANRLSTDAFLSVIGTHDEVPLSRRSPWRRQATSCACATTWRRRARATT